LVPQPLVESEAELGGLDCTASHGLSSQVVSTLGGRRARTREIAGCPQLDVRLFPERKKGERTKTNKKKQQKKGKEPDPVQQSRGQ